MLLKYIDWIIRFYSILQRHMKCWHTSWILDMIAFFRNINIGDSEQIIDKLIIIIDDKLVVC